VVGCGQAGERVGTMIDRRSRHRIHGSIADIVLLELWLCRELDESELEERTLEDAFCRVQARMLVVQALLWPSEDGDDSVDDDSEDEA